VHGGRCGTCKGAAAGTDGNDGMTGGVGGAANGSSFRWGAVGAADAELPKGGVGDAAPIVSSPSSELSTMAENAPLSRATGCTGAAPGETSLLSLSFWPSNMASNHVSSVNHLCFYLAQSVCMYIDAYDYIYNTYIIYIYICNIHTYINIYIYIYNGAHVALR